ncbi:hypothetical protein J4405_03050 [Candidatus Woesearchaeota archaeon]|nr:hypothetical protein [Candidatus Woesearchaeota archaeon]
MKKDEEFWKFFDRNLIYSEETQSFVMRLHSKWKKNMPKDKIKVQSDAFDALKEMQEELKDRVKCPECNSEMINVVDSKTKEISKYLWKCPKGCLGNKILSRG